MPKEQIENIIKDLENHGYEVDYKIYTNNIVSFCCNKHAFTIDYEGASPVVGVGIHVGCRTTFNQKDVDWLNSITDRWEMYKFGISFSFIAKSEDELKNTLLHCVEYF